MILKSFHRMCVMSVVRPLTTILPIGEILPWTVQRRERHGFGELTLCATIVLGARGRPSHGAALRLRRLSRAGATVQAQRPMPQREDVEGRNILLAKNEVRSWSGEPG